ncbi:MAG: murein L,D-transpeptidase catalytic domain family protein [Chitinophagales bacterium]
MALRFLLSLTLLFLGSSFSANVSIGNEINNGSISTYNAVDDLYESLSIPELDKKVFEISLAGYFKLWQNGQLDNPNYLTIVDFSKTSNKERFFLIDLKNKTLVDKSLVAHGRNTGNLKAERFSNIPQSYQSSLGFYTTAETYNGKHGFSLRLDGVEKNFNDKARERAIVIHGADYVSQSFIQTYGRLGRSFGCPSLPEEKSETIINTIKEKSCLFIYNPKEQYLASSKLIKSDLPKDWYSEIFTN